MRNEFLHINEYGKEAIREIASKINKNIAAGNDKMYVMLPGEIRRTGNGVPDLSKYEERVIGTIHSAKAVSITNDYYRVEIAYDTDDQDYVNFLWSFMHMGPTVPFTFCIDEAHPYPVPIIKEVGAVVLTPNYTLHESVLGTPMFNVGDLFFFKIEELLYEGIVNRDTWEAINAHAENPSIYNFVQRSGSGPAHLLRSRISDEVMRTFAFMESELEDDTLTEFRNTLKLSEQSSAKYSPCLASFNIYEGD